MIELCHAKQVLSKVQIAKKSLAQLEVQWVYSGHLVHLRWGTVRALYAIYSGHCFLSDSYHKTTFYKILPDYVVVTICNVNKGMGFWST